MPLADASSNRITLPAGCKILQVFKVATRWRGYMSENFYLDFGLVLPPKGAKRGKVENFAESSSRGFKPCGAQGSLFAPLGRGNQPRFCPQNLVIKKQPIFSKSYNFPSFWTRDYHYTWSKKRGRFYNKTNKRLSNYAEFMDFLYLFFIKKKEGEILLLFYL